MIAQLFFRVIKHPIVYRYLLPLFAAFFAGFLSNSSPDIENSNNEVLKDKGRIVQTTKIVKEFDDGIVSSETTTIKKTENKDLNRTTSKNSYSKSQFMIGGFTSVSLTDAVNKDVTLDYGIQGGFRVYDSVWATGSYQFDANTITFGASFEF